MVRIRDPDKRHARGGPFRRPQAFIGRLIEPLTKPRALSSNVESTNAPHQLVSAHRKIGANRLPDLLHRSAHFPFCKFGFLQPDFNSNWLILRIGVWVLHRQGMPYRKCCHAPILSFPFTWAAAPGSNVPVLSVGGEAQTARATEPTLKRLPPAGQQARFAGRDVWRGVSAGFR